MDDERGAMATGRPHDEETAGEGEADARSPTGVGVTALFIAALRAAESVRPDSVFGDDPLAEAVAGEVDTATARLWVDENGPTPLARGLHDYVGLRTRYFDDYLTGATGAGVRQVVVLGAGLDGRAHRLELAGTTFFEVDAADVLDYKQRVVAAHGLSTRMPVRPVAADLRDDDWSTALAAAGFDHGAPTAWLAEGLLFYLSPRSCENLIGTVTDLSAPGSELAVEYPVGDMVAVLDDIDSGSATRAMIRAFLDAGPQRPPAAWFDDIGWQVNAVSVADWATTLGRTPPEWSTSPDFTWWFVRARHEN